MMKRSTQWGMLVWAWCLYGAIAYAAPMSFIGGAVAGLPAGVCSVFQLARTAGIEIHPGTRILSMDMDTASERLWAGTNDTPLAGAGPINNLFRINTSTMAILTSAPVLLQTNFGDPFCTAVGNLCVVPSMVQSDVTNSLVYVGGYAGRNGAQSLAAVNMTTLVPSTINTYSNTAPITDSSLTFDESLTWVGMGFTRLSDTPSTYSTYRITRGSAIATAQGPVNQTQGSNSSQTLNGNFVLDVNSSLLYLAESDALSPALRLRAYNYSLVDQGSPVVISTVQSMVNYGIVFVPSKNELIVCTSGGMRVYSGFPFVLNRSIAAGCATPVYDSVNNKIYVHRSGQLVRVNYDTLADEQLQSFAGLTANGRLMIDIPRQLVYGEEVGGPSGFGSAVVKYDVCASI